MKRLLKYLQQIKTFFIRTIILRLSYKYWLMVRKHSKNEYGEKLCYCGHTYKCTCGNPDRKMFKNSIENGDIILFDKNNGWETV